MPPLPYEEPESFDPRKHSAVTVTVNEKVPSRTVLAASAEFPLRSFTVGPHVHGPASLRRPSSAPATGRGKKVDPAAPRFLDSNGKWVQQELPVQVLATQAQPLSATIGVLDAAVASTTVKGARGIVRPVLAIHSYHDVSPVITAEHVRDATDGRMGATLVRTQSQTQSQTQARRPSSGGPRTSYGGYGLPSPHYDAATQTFDAVDAATQTAGGAVGRSTGSPYLVDAYRTAGRAQPPRRPASAGRQSQAAWPNGSPAHATANNNRYGMLNTQHSLLDSTFKAGTLGDPLPHPAYISEIYGTPVGNQKKKGTSKVRPQSAAPVPSHQMFQTTRGVVAHNYGTGPFAHEPLQGNKGTRGNATGAQVNSTGYYTNGGPVAGGVYAGAGWGAINGQEAGAPGGVGDSNTVEYKAEGVTPSTAGPYAAAANNPFWPKSATNLARPDLLRVEELGKGITAGGANCRLVGGRWRYIPRPVEGDVVYTDYYGPNGKEHADYYGRSYHVNTAEFAKHRLVNDSAYQKVRASMMGIQALRDRPGLALDAAIVHGPTEALDKVDNVTATTSLRNLHRIHEYHNLKAPGQGR